jgi:hypothetical protein
VLEQQLYLVLCGSPVATTKGIACTHYERIARWLRRGDIVVSFNYDLLIDHALASRGDWAMNDGYDLAFNGIGSHATYQPEWRVPLKTDSVVKLYKLHGSLNWLYCRDPWQQRNLDLHGAVYDRASRALYCLDDMHGDFLQDHPLYEWWARYEHDEGDYTFDLHSLIVPPSLNKPYRAIEGFIGDLWGSVLRRFLTEITEIYLIGYSMREMDLRAWWLFSKAADEASRLRTVHVIDPNDDVYKRVERIFGKYEVRRDYATVADFASALG